MRDALRAVGVALALAAAPARPAPAQTPDQPILIFSISAGLTTGGDLWTIPRQLAFASNNGVQNLFDSVSLGRRLRPGLLAALSATYFRSPHLGYTLEAGFFGLETQSSCDALAPFVPVQTPSPNQQACDFLHGQDLRGDAVGLLAGLTYRFATGGTQPFVRAEAGGAILGSSFVEMTGPALQPDGSETIVYFLSDQNHKELTWMVSLGAGLMLPLAPGYQLRMEARDIILPLPRPLGPATDTGAVAAGSELPQPPIGLKVTHVPSFSVGLDVVLERRRGHRY
ncbi:MAG TPA: hypothetical protein VEH83_05595 [Gemmatimonadales bacterium]|nr:hypothetical protein [Gemmatimonadales bacterium]